jgi:hypothetical protein
MNAHANARRTAAALPLSALGDRLHGVFTYGRD